jgi:hypothetical protein
VLIDLFSRYVVGWMIAGTESGALAYRFVGSCGIHDRLGVESVTGLRRMRSIDTSTHPC